MTSCNVLSEAVKNRNNNLNLVKLIAAVLVIVSHAYAFAVNYQQTDWLSVLTGGKGDFGGLAVNTFFFYSGLLVTFSLLKNGDGKNYWKRRIFRIYPSFILVTFSIVFLIAPWITNLTAGEYFSDARTYAYLKNLIFLNEHNLPGVFTENIYGPSVNGPIWTIRVEMFCYAFCYIFYRLGLLRKKHTVPSVGVYMVMVGAMAGLALKGFDGILAVIMPVTMFYLGMVYAQFADRIKLNGVFAWTAGAGLLLSFVIKQFILGCMVFLPYLLCCLAFSGKKVLHMVSSLGECSYEIYLWGGFIGQLMVYAAGGMMPVSQNMLFTIILSLILGYITNQVVGQINALCRSFKSKSK